jgi:hypothetical protein
MPQRSFLKLGVAFFCAAPSEPTDGPKFHKKEPISIGTTKGEAYTLPSVAAPYFWIP